MKKYLSHIICASLVMSTSAALSDSHLDQTVKFQNGEAYAACVYGEGGIVTEKTGVVGQWRQCGVAWEGIGLYETFFHKQGTSFMTFDLQSAYICCNNDDTRLAICSEQNKYGDYLVCSGYLDSMRGNLRDGTQQTDANDAALYGCIMAVSGNVTEYKEWLLSSKYHGRLDLLYEACMETEDLVYAAISKMFDYLRDETFCLWNNPDKDFCKGSRRKNTRWLVTD